MKRYCKATLNVLSKKKILDDDNFFYFMIDFLCHIKILLLNMWKLIKILGFFLIFQIPGFSRIPGLVVTLFK